MDGRRRRGWTESAVARPERDAKLKKGASARAATGLVRDDESIGQLNVEVPTGGLG